MNLLTRLRRLCTARRATSSAPPPEPVAAPAAEREPAHCGWFDSSLDLNQGLQVQELATTDSALPLAWWLQWHNGRGELRLDAGHP